MLALRPTFFHNSTLPRAVSAGVPTLWPSALWTPCASAATSRPLPRSSTSRRLSTLAGLKPLWFVCHGSSLAPPRQQVRLGGSVSSPWVDSGIAQGRIFLPFFSICSSTVSLSLFVLPSPVSPSLPVTLSVTSASSLRSRRSYCISS